jgi:predicted amidohydrolase
MTSVRVAVVQSEPAPSLDEGLQRTEALVREAARSGASLVAFPETWLPGYPPSNPGRGAVDQACEGNVRALRRGQRRFREADGSCATAGAWRDVIIGISRVLTDRPGTSTTA